MTIKDQARYLESSPDWAMLNGCFGAVIKPEDIDGHVERGGVSLFLEHKLPGASLKKAQDIGFDALRGQGNTVIVFWGQARDGSDITHMQVYWPRWLMPEAPNHPPRKEATLDDLRRACSWWYRKCPAPKYRYSLCHGFALMTASTATLRRFQRRFQQGACG